MGNQGACRGQDLREKRLKQVRLGAASRRRRWRGQERKKEAPKAAMSAGSWRERRYTHCVMSTPCRGLGYLQRTSRCLCVPGCWSPGHSSLSFHGAGALQSLFPTRRRQSRRREGCVPSPLSPTAAQSRVVSIFDRAGTLTSTCAWLNSIWVALEGFTLCFLGWFYLTRR